MLMKSTRKKTICKGSENAEKRFKEQLPVIFIMLLGFLVRIFNLGKDGLWIPEAKVVCFSQKAINGLFNYSDAYRPFYLLLSRIWISFFCTSETSIRFSPVIIGVMRNIEN